MTNEACKRRIKRVLCEDQIQSNSEGPGYAVGWQNCANITEVEENLGTYAIHWFYIWDKDNNLISKLNASYVMQVEYEVGGTNG